MTPAGPAVAVRLVVGLVLLAGLAPRAAAAPAKTPTFFEVVAAHFDAWDADHDGRLSAAELARLVADRRVRGPQAAAVAAIALVARGDDAHARPAGGFTRDHFAALADGRPAAKAGPPYAGLYAAGVRHLATVGNRPLFGDGGPSLHFFHQGPIADCFVLAPLGALVARDPAAVGRLIRRVNPAYYSVSFARRLPAMIKAPTDAEIIMSADSAGHGVWINVFEMAFADNRARLIPAGRPKPSDLDGIAHAGSTAATLTALTGHRVRTLQIRKDADPVPAGAAAVRIAAQVDQLLRAAVQGRRLVCASSAAKQTTPGLVTSHAHAVVGYDPAARAVRLWNPHGNTFTPKGPAGPATGYPTKDGFFTMPLADFVGAFRAVEAEEAK